MIQIWNVRLHPRHRHEPVISSDILVAPKYLTKSSMVKKQTHVASIWNLHRGEFDRGGALYHQTLVYTSSPSLSE